MYFKTAAVILATVMCVMSCTGDTIDPPTPPEPPTDDPTLSTDAPSEITFNADGTGGMSVITVTTNQDSWGHEVDPADGHGWLNVTVEEDTLLLTASPSDREVPRENVVITVTAGEATPVTITVKQETYVTPPPYEGTLYNLEGLTGEITVTYFDASTEVVAIEDGVAKVEKTDSKWIYSITHDDAGEVLIGRMNNSEISLKFVDGALTHREAVAGRIPVGSYAEFALINANEDTLKESYFQEADLDLLGSEDIETAGLSRQNWKPIEGVRSEAGEATVLPFIGNFDGRNLSIANIYINNDSALRVGLFGLASGSAAIANINLTSGSITGTMTGQCYVAGICAHHTGGTGTIVHCSNAAEIKSANYYAGGISGENACSIVLCCNTATITAYNAGGGITAINTSNELKQSYNTGSVKSADGANDAILGGICGNNLNGTLTGCYSTGRIEDLGTSAPYVGGIAGLNSGNIYACYNTAEISTLGAMANVGGIVGSNDNNADSSNSIIACYNTGAISAESMHPAGGITGYNSARVLVCFYLADNGTDRGIGGDWGSVKMESNCPTFSATVWPGVGSAPDGGGWTDAGWGYMGDGSYKNWWASHGAWEAGGAPDGINSTFPTLWWED